MQASGFQIISISGPDKIIWSQNDIQKLKKWILENVKKDYEMEFQTTFENLILATTKLLNVELEILSSNVPKCEKERQDFSLVVFGGVAEVNMKNHYFSEFFNCPSEFIYNINRENINFYAYDLARTTYRSSKLFLSI